MGAPRIQVFTYKAGLLAKLGHDLVFALAAAQLELDATRIRGRFRLDSLRVEGALRGGRVDAEALDVDDKREIERAAGEFLQSRQHPEAILDAHVASQVGDRFQVRGDLTLCGQARPIAFELRISSADAGVLLGSIELTPSRWGIAPHRAFGGALKLQDRVGLQVALPVDLATLDDEGWRSAHAVWTMG